MYCELISAVVILVINIPLSLSLDYHFHVCSESVIKINVPRTDLYDVPSTKYTLFKNKKLAVIDRVIEV